MTDPRQRFKSFWWGRRRKRKLAGDYTSDEDHAEVQMSYDIGDNMDELVAFAKAEVAKMLGTDPAPGDSRRPNPTPYSRTSTVPTAAAPPASPAAPAPATSTMAASARPASPTRSAYAAPSSRGQLAAGIAKCGQCGIRLTPREVDYLNRNPRAIRYCYPCTRGGAAPKPEEPR